jgi:hypothetical protein
MSWEPWLKAQLVDPLPDNVVDLKSRLIERALEEAKPQTPLEEVICGELTAVGIGEIIRSRIDDPLPSAGRTLLRIK